LNYSTDTSEIGETANQSDKVKEHDRDDSCSVAK